VDDMPEAGFSLEVQSKPAYSAVRSETTIVHELGHLVVMKNYPPQFKADAVAHATAVSRWWRR
ncbi:hypothetical protein ACWDG1_47210, partial [Streptomyces sp. NPDC001177]